MNNSTPLAKLRDVLASLYSDTQSAHRIASDVGLDTRHIDFDGRAINFWHSILTEARNAEKIDQLLNLVFGEYPNNSNLRIAYEDFYRSSLQTEKLVASQDAPEPGNPPYKGLLYFQEADADIFVGRESLTDELIAHLRKYAFLAIIGASGSGKSSLVRAGLIRRLRGSNQQHNYVATADERQYWPIHIITPTAHPLEALAASLTRDDKSVTTTATLIDDLNQDIRSLHLFARKLLSVDSSNPRNRLLIIVDQFEELFTHCHSHNERQVFVANLLNAAKEDGMTTVVITLSADFYAHCAEFEDLRQMFERYQRYIGRMSPNDLKRAITEPAQRGNWAFETGLEEQILKDVIAEPGALPLLSQALRETWEQRRGRTLTYLGYFAAGRVQGAIAKKAESTFTEQLSQHEQDIAKNIFLCLTEVSESNLNTRRSAVWGELAGAGRDVSMVETVLKKLADARLITSDQNKVEIAHEALIREWPRLDKWLEADREGLRIHRRLTEAAVTWKEMKCNPHDLFRGTRLDQALEWRANHPHDLNKTEQEFLDASLAERQRLIEEKTRIEQERADAQQRELMQARRVRNGAWAAFAATAIALILAVIIGWQLYDENRKAQVEHLLVEARELKAALQPYDAIEKLKAAEGAANRINVNLGIDMHSEINDVVRHVAIQWVQQGEKLTAEGSLVEAAVKFRNILALNPPPDVPVYVWIEPGDFVMGTIEHGQSYDSEKPQHSVSLRGYWILRTEVTNQLYLRCINEGPCTKPGSTHWDKPQFANWPVNGVEWEQANTYANWVGGRLPTEAEWEKACRGTDGRIYPWGNNFPSPQLLNYQQSDVYEIASIGSYPAGTNSLYDMAGNVYEWTSSIYRPYPYKAEDGRERAAPNESWVYRGGSFSSSELNVRCAFRNKTTPGVMDNSIGFRVVLPGP